MAGFRLTGTMVLAALTATVMAVAAPGMASAHDTHRGAHVTYQVTTYSGGYGDRRWADNGWDDNRWADSDRWDDDDDNNWRDDDRWDRDAWRGHDSDRDCDRARNQDRYHRRHAYDRYRDHHRWDDRSDHRGW